MMDELNRDPALRRFRAAVDATYGARVERIVLYGSRARGAAGLNSDYDIAVFLGIWRIGPMR